MPVSAGLGIADILGGIFAAAPEAAAAAAPEVAAAAAPEFAGIALPEIAVTAAAPAELGATLGPGLAAGEAGAAAAGAAGAGDVLSGLGLGSALGIGPALAGGLTPAGIVGGEFDALNQAGIPSTAGGGAGVLPSTPVPTIPIGGGTAASSPLSPGAQGGPGPADTILPDTTTIGPGGIGPATGTAVGSPLDLTSATTPSAATPAAAAGGASNFFSKNAGLLSLLGLGVGGQLAGPAIQNALGLNKVPGSQDLKALAQQEANLASGQQQIAQTLEQPLITGVLPPGQQQAVTNALNDAITTIKSRYANLGLSGSSMEAQAIADAQNRSIEVAGQLEQQMAQTGVSAVSTATSALGLESQIYDTILNAQIKQDEQLGNAISGFANAVGLGTALNATKAA